MGLSVDFRQRICMHRAGRNTSSNRFMDLFLVPMLLCKVGSLLILTALKRLVDTSLSLFFPQSLFVLASSLFSAFLPFFLFIFFFLFFFWLITLKMRFIFSPGELSGLVRLDYIYVSYIFSSFCAFSVQDAHSSVIASLVFAPESRGAHEFVTSSEYLFHFYLFISK